MLLISLGIAYSVISRYLLKVPIQEINEAAQYLMLIGVFLAAGHALDNNKHVSIELVTSWLSPDGRRILAIITTFLSLFWIGCLVYKTAEITWMTYVRNIRSSDATNWLLFPFYVWMPIGTSLLFLAACGKINSYLSGGRDEESAYVSAYSEKKEEKK